MIGIHRLSRLSEVYCEDVLCRSRGSHVNAGLIRQRPYNRIANVAHMRFRFIADWQSDQFIRHALQEYVAPRPVAFGCRGSSSIVTGPSFFPVFTRSRVSRSRSTLRRCSAMGSRQRLLLGRADLRPRRSNGASGRAQVVPS